MLWVSKVKNWFRERRSESFGAALVKTLAMGGLLITGLYYVSKNKPLWLTYTAGAVLLALACQRYGAHTKVFVTAMCFWWMLVWTVYEHVEKLFSVEKSDYPKE